MASGQIRREVAKEATNKQRQNSKITRESRIASRLKTKANGLRARSSTAAKGGISEPERVWRCNSTKTSPSVAREMATLSARAAITLTPVKWKTALSKSGHTGKATAGL